MVGRASSPLNAARNSALGTPSELQAEFAHCVVFGESGNIDCVLKHVKPGSEGLSILPENSAIVLTPGRSAAGYPDIFMVFVRVPGRLDPFTDPLKKCLSHVCHVIECASSRAFSSNFKLPNRQPYMEDRRHNA